MRPCCEAVLKPPHHLRQSDHAKRETLFPTFI